MRDYVAARAPRFPCGSLHAIHEREVAANERQQVRAVEPTPPGLRHVQELVG